MALEFMPYEQAYGPGFRDMPVGNAWCYFVILVGSKGIIVNYWNIAQATGIYLTLKLRKSQE